MHHLSIHSDLLEMPRGIVSTGVVSVMGCSDDLAVLASVGWETADLGRDLKVLFDEKCLTMWVCRKPKFCSGHFCLSVR